MNTLNIKIPQYSAGECVNHEIKLHFRRIIGARCRLIKIYQNAVGAIGNNTHRFRLIVVHKGFC